MWWVAILVSADPTWQDSRLKPHNVATQLIYCSYYSNVTLCDKLFSLNIVTNRISWEQVSLQSNNAIFWKLVVFTACFRLLITRNKTQPLAIVSILLLRDSLPSTENTYTLIINIIYIISLNLIIANSGCW